MRICQETIISIYCGEMIFDTSISKYVRLYDAVD